MSDPGMPAWLDELRTIADTAAQQGCHIELSFRLVDSTHQGRNTWLCPTFERLRYTLAHMDLIRSTPGYPPRRKTATKQLPAPLALGMSQVVPAIEKRRGIL